MSSFSVSKGKKTALINTHLHPKAASLHISQGGQLSGGRQQLGSVKTGLAARNWLRSGIKCSWQLWRIRILLKGDLLPSEDGKHIAEGGFCLPYTAAGMDCRCLWRPKQHRQSVRPWWMCQLTPPCLPEGVVFGPGAAAVVESVIAVSWDTAAVGAILEDSWCDNASQEFSCLGQSQSHACLIRVRRITKPQNALFWLTFSVNLAIWRSHLTLLRTGIQLHNIPPSSASEKAVS